MSINKNIKYLLFVLIMLVMIPFSVSAYAIKETSPAVNTFSIFTIRLCSTSEM